MSAPTDPAGWRYRAACRDEDPELFFFEGSPDAPANTAQINEAKKVCAGCPVQLRCLLWAMKTKTDYGVFGGLTETERASARRMEMRRAAQVRKEAAA
jgi:WhiB family redox-sensing transcriptional regulator